MQCVAKQDPEPVLLQKLSTYVTMVKIQKNYSYLCVKGETLV